MSKKKLALAAVALILVVGGDLARRAWFPRARETGYRFVDSWGGPGSEPGLLESPIGIALGGAEVFVSDSGNHRIQVFDRDGRFLRAFGKRGSEHGELDRPMHIDVRQGKLYVAEYLNDRIQVFKYGYSRSLVIGARKQ